MDTFRKSIERPAGGVVNISFTAVRVEYFIGRNYDFFISFIVTDTVNIAECVDRKTALETFDCQNDILKCAAFSVGNYCTFAISRLIFYFFAFGVCSLSLNSEACSRTLFNLSRRAADIPRLTVGAGTKTGSVNGHRVRLPVNIFKLNVVVGGTDFESVCVESDIVSGNRSDLFEFAVFLNAEVTFLNR